MKIEVRTINISQSKIRQMTYAGVPTNPDTQVLGWVSMDKKRWVIVKIDGNYYRAEFLVKVEKAVASTQISIHGDRAMLTHAYYVTYNGGKYRPTPSIDEAQNIALYEWLLVFQEKTIQAGQIYY